MNKQELRELIDSMDAYMPICNIEKELGMAKTTLQKALKYEDKKLPKKWVKPLINFCKKRASSQPENNLIFHNIPKKELDTGEPELSSEIKYEPGLVIYDVEKGNIPDHDEPKMYKESPPNSIQQIKNMCPAELTGIRRTMWIEEQKEKYNIS